MNQMFLECNSIKNISFPRYQNASLYTMNEMFYNCKNLENICLPRFDEDKVENLQLFKGCESLKKISVGSQHTKIIKQNPSLKKKFSYKKDCFTF